MPALFWILADRHVEELVTALKTIAADPPWRYKSSLPSWGGGGGNGQCSVQHHDYRRQ